VFGSGIHPTKLSPLTHAALLRRRLRLTDAARRTYPDVPTRLLAHTLQRTTMKIIQFAGGVRHGTDGLPFRSEYCADLAGSSSTPGTGIALRNGARQRTCLG